MSIKYIETFCVRDFKYIFLDLMVNTVQSKTNCAHRAITNLSAFKPLDAVTHRLTLKRDKPKLSHCDDLSLRARRLVLL